jgi:2,3-bisphosphoglycerate-dependent phosphoglycerate mutase
VQEEQYLALVRHGQSWSNLGLATSCGLFYSHAGSDRSVSLTRQGELEIAVTSRRLANFFPRHRKITRLFHTSFKRVEQSAAIVRYRLPYKVKLVCDERLSKRGYGRFWNLTRTGVQQLHPHEWLRYESAGDLHYRAPEGGENYYDLFDRIDDFIDTVVTPSRGNLAVVTSSAPILAFRRRLEGLTDANVVAQYEDQAIANASVILYRREDPEAPWQRCDF